MSVETYRKIPVEIKAIQYEPDTLGECVQFLKENDVRFSVDCMGFDDETKFEFFTLDGKITVSMGDYIVRGAEGECYLCKPDIFLKTYENVKEI